MNKGGQRRSERILLTIPILVMGSDPATEEFSEETHTVVVNRHGGRIALQHRVAAEDTVRIINLESLSEAEFRVVGPVSSDGAEAVDWGVECLKEGQNIWGIEFSSSMPSEGMEPCALLECRACGKKFFWPLTLMEVEVLDSTGIIQNFCDPCGKPTYWMYADPSLRPREILPSEPVAPPPPSLRPAERRGEKRHVAKLPILVRNQKGEEEVTKTENISRGDLAVSLALKMAVGEIVTLLCPYTAGGQNIEKKAKVLRCSSSFFGRSRLYGFGLIR